MCRLLVSRCGASYEMLGLFYLPGDEEELHMEIAGAGRELRVRSDP